MGQEKKIKDFKFLYLKNDYFKIGIREERLRNDILLIKYDESVKTPPGHMPRGCGRFKVRTGRLR